MNIADAIRRVCAAYMLSPEEVRRLTVYQLELMLKAI